jgi:RNA polymerase sigma-70 factor (ECF subfamily)
MFARRTNDEELLERMLAGDESAFEELVDSYHRSMFGLAKTFVDDSTIAEEIVQETWLAVIDGLDRFEGRSTLETWIFGILSNVARTRLRRDARAHSWSQLFEGSIDEEFSESDERFDSSGRWSTPPQPWGVDPEQRLMRRDLLEVIGRALDELPSSQSAVVRLRDVEGLSSREVCEILEISRANQRVLLHRGRVAVREAIAAHLADDDEVSE